MNISFAASTESEKPASVDESPASSPQGAIQRSSMGSRCSADEDAFSQKSLIHQLIAPLGPLWLIDIAADYDFVDTCPHVEVFFVGLSITLPLAVKN